MTTPNWALALAYWLHMLATVIWIGGLAALSIFVLPAARKTLEIQPYARLVGSIQKRLNPWSWFSLALLLATGMLQMSANPNYQGFLAFENRWAVAILLKHILFLGMAGIAAYLTWVLLPKLQRLALMQARQGREERPASQANNLHRQETTLVRLNLILGILVLLLTAIARTA